MINRESYKRGFIEALEAVQYLMATKKYTCKKAVELLLTAAKEDRINQLLNQLGIP